MGVPSSARGRFALLVAACTLSAIAAIVIAARNAGTSAGPPRAAAHALARARAEKRPVVVFRSLDRGAPGSFGQLALSNLRGSATTRTRQALRCERAYFGPTTGLCLTRGNGFAAGYRAEIPVVGYQRRTVGDSARDMKRVGRPLPSEGTLQIASWSA